MAQRRASRLQVAALLTIGGSACDGEPRFTDASGGPNYHLEESYPAELRAEDVVLNGELIARGDSLYHGVIGRANCVICHGPFLTGGSDGTNLRDDNWHNGDGSHSFIISTIINGVSKPDHLTMPPRGGMPVSNAEVRAIAAYVYWYSKTKEAAGEIPSRSQTP